METIVDDTVWIVDSKKVVPDEHLEHSPGEIVVHARVALRARSVPVEDKLTSYLLHRAADCVGAITISVIVDEVREATFFGSNLGVDDLRNSLPVLRQQLICCGRIDFESVSVT